MFVPINQIQEFAVKHLPIKVKHSPNGWVSFNCPACMLYGEPTPDKKKRMGLHLDHNGGIQFHCFRCSMSPRWEPGNSISKKLQQLFELLGANKNEVYKLNLECLRIKQEYEETGVMPISQVEDYKKVILPENSKTFTEWSSSDDFPQKCQLAFEYILNRNIHFMEWFDDFRWSPKMPNRIIIPLKYHNNIFGWSARSTNTNSKEPRYLMNNESKFLFGSHHLDSYYDLRKYALLVEGPLDAIALDGVAFLGDTVSPAQMKWLDSSEKQIVVFPDRDNSGVKLVELAQKNHWLVSMPDLTAFPDVKDGLDLVNTVGRLMALKMIFEAATDNILQIDIQKKTWFTNV